MPDVKAGGGYRRLELQDFDPDAFAQVIRGGRFDHDLIHPGSLNATLERLAGCGIVLDVGHYDFATIVRGGFDPELMCFGMVDCRGGETRINGRNIAHDDLQVYAEGAELLYQSGVDTTWIGLQVARDVLQRAAIESLRRELPLFTHGDRNLRLKPATAKRLRRCATSVLSDARKGSSTTAGCHALLDALCEACIECDRGHAHVERQSTEQRRAIVGRVITWMHENAEEGYSSIRLCDSIAVSERRLQLCFRQVLGVSPSRYFACMRLNAVRRMLASGSRSDCSVTGAALRYGFSHFGRFAQEYRELFGEVPSTTLLRAPCHPQAWHRDPIGSAAGASARSMERTND